MAHNQIQELEQRLRSPAVRHGARKVDHVAVAQQTELLIREILQVGDRDLYLRAIDAYFRATVVSNRASFRTTSEYERRPGWNDGAIRFLEADLWFHSSGYKKENLLRYLSRMELRDAHKARLTKVVIRQVDRRDGREFRDYCRMAHAINSCHLRRQLEQRLSSSDPDVRRRAGWMLDCSR